MVRQQRAGMALGALAFALFSGGLQAQTLTLGPYLQNVTETSVVVRFGLDAAAEAEVRFGPTDAYGSVVTAPPAAEFELRLDGLTAGTETHYRLFAGGVPLCDDIAFWTAPPPRAPFRMLVLGDTRSDHDTHRAIVEAASATAPRVWVHTGDMVSSGEVLEDWLTFFSIESPLMRSVPQFGAIGNHDEDSGDATNYLRFYALPENGLAREFYYSFTYGNLHGIVLDGHVNVNPEWQCILRIGAWDTCFTQQQLDWLAADLAAAAADPDIDHIFVFLHMGPYSSKEGRSGYAQIRELLPSFRDHGVEMIITGHDHYYERGFSDNGIAYVIAAGGGAPLYETWVPPTSPPHSVVMNETVYHYVTIDVDWLCVSMTATRLDGTVLDTYATCSEPRACAVPEADCGALPPSCAAGRWVCDAGFCSAVDCEGVEEPLEEVEEPAADTAEPDDPGPADVAPDPDAADPDADEVPPPDVPGDVAGEEEHDAAAGCGCSAAT
jgi:3',5'-cyclic AMP phosphodiesterase CpdA